jgi:hypothetical protein
MAEAKIRASLFVDNLPYFYEATVCTFFPGALFAARSPARGCVQNRRESDENGLL